MGATVSAASSDEGVGMGNHINIQIPAQENMLLRKNFQCCSSATNDALPSASFPTSTDGVT